MSAEPELAEQASNDWMVFRAETKPRNGVWRLIDVCGEAEL